MCAENRDGTLIGTNDVTVQAEILGIGRMADCYKAASTAGTDIPSLPDSVATLTEQGQRTAQRGASSLCELRSGQFRLDALRLAISQTTSLHRHPEARGISRFVAGLVEGFRVMTSWPWNFRAGLREIPPSSG